jgi:hypothetical protein
VVRVLGALSVWADLTIERWLLAKKLPVNDWLLWGYQPIGVIIIH